uniref:Uncharacterized protein n=1 Tax=Panagrolaimus davidi TaxID=227884 RepID=A0A914QUV0_9BILA
MFKFLKSPKRGGGGDQKKKHRERPSQLKKKNNVRSRGSTPDNKPKFGEPIRTQRPPPTPQTIFIKAQTQSDSSAPKKSQKLPPSAKDTYQKISQPQQQNARTVPRPPPAQAAPLMPRTAPASSQKLQPLDNQSNRFTFREYLAGVRLQPTSPNRAPPKSTQPPPTQQIPRQPVIRPSPPKRQPPLPKNSEPKKEVQSKSKASQSEKKQTTAKAVTLKNVNNGKSTEKIAECTLTIKELDK